MSDVFNEVCPYYLNMGMTLAQFWDKSPYWAVYVRKSYALQRQEHNQEMWWQGFYVYHAFGAVMAEFSYGLSGRKGAKPKGYLKQPIPITTREKDDEKQRRIKHTLEWVAKGQE